MKQHASSVACFLHRRDDRRYVVVPQFLRTSEAVAGGRAGGGRAGGGSVRMRRGCMLFVVAGLAEIGGLCQESAESWLCFICNVAVRKKACRRGVFSSARG